MKTPQKQTDATQSRKGLLWFFLILVLAAELICNSWIRSESSQAIIRITDTERRLRKLAAYRQALGVEIERLKSEARITRIARTRLGLASDIFNQTIYLPKERT
ncbi:MAG: cell division protein FtsL [Desulfobacter postgatei]|uniref:Cell division protein FtsL n=1 Tax=Desulfobacter postgatei TaxID=2293 RepID=A0A2G6MT67_9BACT|nr:MAG: cell division protein FtsL [Desulfobacter postgatei]